jgi:hypothetical protein
MNRHRSLYDTPLLAFVHIPKAGGTTLIHLLRRNYFMKYCDVRPLRKQNEELFTADDLKTYLRMNPFIECIGGHAVRAYSNLDSLFPNIRYITILRNPVDRCVSHYQQRVMKFGNLPFDEFLKREWVSNLQTRHIAGSEDVELAKEILSERFFAVGVLDKFNEFLATFANKLLPEPFDSTYQVMRVAKDKHRKQEILEVYEEAILESHQADSELYEFAKREILPRQGKACTSDSDISRSVEGSDLSEAHARFPVTKQRIDYLIRKIYYEPVSGAIRILHGLPAGKH